MDARSKALEDTKKLLKRPTDLIEKIHEILIENKMTITRFLAIADRKSAGVIDSETMLSAISLYGGTLTKQQIESAFKDAKGGKPTSLISTASIQELYCKKYPAEYPLTEDISLLLRHLSMKMQIHRIPRDSLLTTLYGRPDNKAPLSVHELARLLRKRPLAISSPQDSEALARFLLGNQFIATYKTAGDTLLEFIENWTILTSAEEGDFDQQLSQVILEQRSSIKNSCKTHDKCLTGTISVENFKEVLNDLKIYFSEELLSYMSLLFYTNSYQLDIVPYKRFLKAYSEPLNERVDNEIDEKQTKMVKKYLERIAEKLQEKGLTVKEAFAESNGFISYEQFAEGLRELSMPEVPEQDLRMIVEALQYEEDYEVPCVFLEELEDVLGFYGTKQENGGTNSSFRMSDGYGQRFESSEDESEKNSVIVKDYYGEEDESSSGIGEGGNISYRSY